MGNNKLILFDFCETLIKFQTADKYVEYCREHLRTKRMRSVHQFTVMLEKLRFFKAYNRIRKGNNLHKRLILWQLKGIDKATCERMAKQYFEEMLLPNVIPDIINLLRKHQEQGDDVWIISGGYDIYIKCFVDYFNINGFISSKIGFSATQECTGKMDGPDCMRDNKIPLLKERFGRNPDQFDITFYTDSQSDLPLLQTVQHPYVISRQNHQKWIDNYNYKEIIWT